MPESKRLSQLSLAIVEFLYILDERVFEDREAGLTLRAINHLIGNAGLTDGFGEVLAAYKEFCNKPQYRDLPDIASVITYLVAHEITAERQAKVDALAKKVVNVRPRWAYDLVGRGSGTNYMFHLFTYTPAQLVRYFGEQGARDITAYFAKVGLTHGEPLDPELEAELRRMGLWRDRAALDPAFSNGNKS
jgi:hypothetical protein